MGYLMALRVGELGDTMCSRDRRRQAREVEAKVESAPRRLAASRTLLTTRTFRGRRSSPYHAVATITMISATTQSNAMIHGTPGPDFGCRARPLVPSFLAAATDSACVELTNVVADDGRARLLRRTTALPSSSSEFLGGAVPRARSLVRPPGRVPRRPSLHRVPRGRDTRSSGERRGLPRGLRRNRVFGVAK